MPKALIAEPDEAEARKQAAILGDEGWETLLSVDGDVLEALSRDHCDVLILRNERPGQKGTALVSRIKKQKLAESTAIVLTTSELSPEAIEKHQGGKFHADHYIRLPLSRQDLIDAAQAGPQVVDVDQDLDVIETSTEGPPVLEEAAPSEADPNRPPPLPGKKRGSAVQTRRWGREGTEELSPDELKFVENVFSSIQHIDPDKPTLDDKGDLKGPDRKVALLRKNLKDRERELSKLSRLWRTREQELDSAAALHEEKEIEIEGLKLKITELEEEIEQAHETMESKIAEFGSTLGEQYDMLNLREAELIQEVAKKENEFSKLDRKLKKTEEAKTQGESELTDRIFEWERAYHEYESHHWEVVRSSYEEVLRLEDQISLREADRHTVSEELKGREEELSRAQLLIEELRRDLFALQQAHHDDVLAAHVAGDRLYYQERLKRHEADDERLELKARVSDLEERLFRTDRLLPWMDQQRRRDIAQLVTVIEERERDLMHTHLDRSEHVAEARLLEATLSAERAIGEAAIAHLIEGGDRERKITKRQLEVRDGKLDDLYMDVEQLNGQVASLTERLSSEEMERSAETARADDAEVELAETQATLESTTERLEGEVKDLSHERDRLSTRLKETEETLDSTKAELQEEKLNRATEHQEARLAIEQRDGELKARDSRIGELERDLQVSREDIGTLRQTVSARDERIEELMGKIRSGDEQIVALEGQVDRLTTSVAEQKADLQGRQQALVQLQEKLASSSERIDALENSERELGDQLAKTQQGLETTEQQKAGYEAALAKEEQSHRDAQHTITERETTLAEAIKREEDLQRDLEAARSDIAAGQTVTEQVQGRLDQTDGMLAEVRGALAERDGELNELHEQHAALNKAHAELENVKEQTWSALAETQEELGLQKEALKQKAAELAQLSDTHQALDQARNELSRELGAVTEKRDELEGRLGQTEAKLASTQSDLEVARSEKDTLAGRAGELDKRLGETEGARAALEEQLSQQIAENGEQAATIGDLGSQLDRQRKQLGAVEGQLLDKDTELKERAAEVTQLHEQTGLVAAKVDERTAEIAELTQSLEEQKLAVDERAKWLKTRESRIAELEGQLHQEKETRAAVEQQQVQGAQAAEQTHAQLTELQQQLATAQAAAKSQSGQLQQQLQAAQQELANKASQVDQMIAEREGLQAQASQLEHSQAQLAQTQARVQELEAQGQAAVGQLAQKQAASEKEHAEAAKASQERDQFKTRMQEVARQLEAEQARATQLTQASEQANARLADMTDKAQKTQELARKYKAAHDAEQKKAVDLAGRLEAMAEKGEADGAALKKSLEEERAKLQRDLLDARKAARASQAAEKQARAERDQMKRTAEAKLKEMAARLRGSKAAKPASKPVPAAVPAAVPESPAAPADPFAAKPTLVAETKPPTQ